MALSRLPLNLSTAKIDDLLHGSRFVVYFFYGDVVILMC